MKLIFFGFFFFSGIISYSQEPDKIDSLYINVSDEKIYNYLNDSVPNQLSFGCFAGGYLSNNIELFLVLSKRKRIDLIYELRNSKVNATKYIAIEFILKASQKELIQLNEDDFKSINKFKKSRKMTKVCNGCDGYMDYDIRGLFYKDDDYGDETRKWIERLLNKYFS